MARIEESTDGLPAHPVVEAVGNRESVMQTIRSTRPIGHVAFVGVCHGFELPDEELSFAEIDPLGGGGPMRHFPPHPFHLISSGTIDPGKVFAVVEGNRASDERCAIRALFQP